MSEPDGCAPSECDSKWAPTVVETHVSVLVFFDDIVLKYKKPVHLPFVDFTSRENRLAACEEETESNRRLSPDVYLGVADVRLGRRVLDHAVVMRRLPRAQSLEQLVRTGPPLDHHLRRLARVLADFHAGAQRTPEIDDNARITALSKTLSQSIDTIKRLPGGLVDPDRLEMVGRLAMAYLKGRGPLFEERIARRAICDGHGDLLASDVFFLEDGPRVLDCVEFDPRIRHVDVVADIAFLVMDLERLGARHAADQFVHLYCEASGDAFPKSLLHYYCAQRAIVRAEVACLRAEEERCATSSRADVGSERIRAERNAAACELLDLALEHLLAGQVVLGVVSGLPGTGKSTLASLAAEKLDWTLLRSDEIRREVVGAAGSEVLTDRFGAGFYAAKVTERTYRAMLDRAKSALVRGKCVIVDATFADAGFRAQAAELAADTSSRLAAVECSAAIEVAVERVGTRRREGVDVSGADEEVVRAMALRASPWPVAVTVDTTQRPVIECLGEIVRVFSSGDETVVGSELAERGPDYEEQPEGADEDRNTPTR